jgi:hypothetical protein
MISSSTHRNGLSEENSEVHFLFKISPSGLIFLDFVHRIKFSSKHNASETGSASAFTCKGSVKILLGSIRYRKLVSITGYWEKIILNKDILLTSEYYHMYGGTRDKNNGF